MNRVWKGVKRQRKPSAAKPQNGTIGKTERQNRVLPKLPGLVTIALVMAQIKPEACEVSFESVFKGAVLFKDAHLDEAAKKCLDIFASYGLGANHISLMKVDEAFNYTLSFSLFNGNGTFRISAEKISIYFKNARGDTDLELITDCVARLYENLQLPEFNFTSINGTAHATFPSIEGLQQYLIRYANPAKQIVDGGTIAFVRSQNWPQIVRLMVERSLIYPSGIFLSWSTTHPEKKPSRELLANVKEAFNEAMTKLDLTWATPS